MTRMMELAHKDFKIATVNTFKALKEDMNLMRIIWKIEEKRTPPHPKKKKRKPK